MMIRWNSMLGAANNTSGFWLRRMGLGWLLSFMMLSMSWSGCASPRVRVLTGAETVTRVNAGETITVTNSGYLVSEAMMKRILRAVNDEILRTKTQTANGRQ